MLNKLNGVLLLTALSFPTTAITYVDIELQLLVDISGSINSSEYDLQLQGYQAAFEGNRLQDAIINGSQGQIAVQLIMWSGSNQQEVMIDWALIDSAETSNDFADNIALLSRPFSGMTAIGSAIEYAYPLFEGNGFSGFSQIIDISGDGTKNAGTSIVAAKNNALDNGVETINGIVITDDQNVIDQYYNKVIGGDTPFLLAPEDFDAFQNSIENKIVAEIIGSQPSNIVSIPEPKTVHLLIISVIVFMFKRFNFGRIQHEKY